MTGIMTHKLILASGSRYRRELLDQLGLDYETESPDVDESSLPGETPRATALRLAALKARVVWERHPGAVVIGSDQTADLHPEPASARSRSFSPCRARSRYSRPPCA